MTAGKLPVTVLISGSGSTLKNLIDHANEGKLDIDIRLVISSRANVGGLEHATKASIPQLILPRKKFSTAEAFRDANFEAITASGSELVIMGGYLQHLLIPDAYVNKVINIHPSLIPSFSGHGYYGLAVHQAAIEYGVKVSGCTVHFVDNDYDHGPIIAQRVCEVDAMDTAEALQQRVGGLERQLLPEVVQAFAENRVCVEGRSVRMTV
jgi:phosphoribosylglycinamide formyltransferase 1